MIRNKETGCLLFILDNFFGHDILHESFVDFIEPVRARLKHIHLKHV